MAGQDLRLSAGGATRPSRDARHNGARRVYGHHRRAASRRSPTPCRRQDPSGLDLVSPRDLPSTGLRSTRRPCSPDPQRPCATSAPMWLRQAAGCGSPPTIWLVLDSAEPETDPRFRIARDCGDGSVGPRHGLRRGAVSLWMCGCSLGAAFMLLETRAVVQMALLFGSTCVVTPSVFFTILVFLTPLANLFVLEDPDRSVCCGLPPPPGFLAVASTVPLDVFMAAVHRAYALPCLLALGPGIFCRGHFCRIVPQCAHHFCAGREYRGIGGRRPRGVRSRR